MPFENTVILQGYSSVSDDLSNLFKITGTCDGTAYLAEYSEIYAFIKASEIIGGIILSA
jgi:hypothetical protein